MTGTLLLSCLALAWLVTGVLHRDARRARRRGTLAGTAPAVPTAPVDAAPLPAAPGVAQPVVTGNEVSWLDLLLAPSSLMPPGIPGRVPRLGRRRRRRSASRPPGMRPAGPRPRTARVH